MFKKITAVLPSLAVCLLLISGCSDNDEYVPIIPADPVTHGTVVKGLIQNALVCEDANNNLVCDPEEAQTRSNSVGNYYFEKIVEGTIIAILDENSFDTSLQRSYNLILYTGNNPENLNRDITIFTTLETVAMNELNISGDEANKIIAEKFGVDPEWTVVDYISTDDLNKTQKDDIETASAYVLQLLYRTQESVNEVNATEINLLEDSKEITQSLLEVLLDDNVISLVDLDTNETLVISVVEQTIENLPDTLLSDDINASLLIKESAKVINEENNTTLFTTEVIEPVVDPAAAFKALYAVPITDEEGNIINPTELTGFEITDQQSNIELNERNITLSFTLDGEKYEDLILPFTDTVYGSLIGEDSSDAVAIGINTKLGDDRLNAGNYFVFYNSITGIEEYWGLADKETICTQNNPFVIDAVQLVNSNTLECDN